MDERHLDRVVLLVVVGLALVIALLVEALELDGTF